jgi:hypothetical protein
MPLSLVASERWVESEFDVGFNEPGDAFGSSSEPNFTMEPVVALNRLWPVPNSAGPPRHPPAAIGAVPEEEEEEEEEEEAEEEEEEEGLLECNQQESIDAASDDELEPSNGSDDMWAMLDEQVQAELDESMRAAADEAHVLAEQQMSTYLASHVMTPEPIIGKSRSRQHLSSVSKAPRSVRRKTSASPRLSPTGPRHSRHAIARCGSRSLRPGGRYALP